MSTPAIGDYAILGDGRSAALVSRGGSVDWLCWPRFDSPSIFAAVLDGERGGAFRIAPRGATKVTRAYVDDSNVLVTTFEGPNGRVRITDLMPICSEGDKARMLVPEHELLRLIECQQGEAEIEVCFEPRPDYGRRPLRLRTLSRLGIRLEDGPRLYTLQGTAPLTVRDTEGAYGVVSLRAGERASFSLTFDSEGPAVLAPADLDRMDSVERTVAWWRAWAQRCTYRGPHRREVIRSMLVLKLLSYAPSGALIAAPTTSLPERPGGDLNWDYRYCWLRDASLTVRVLDDLGYCDESAAFVSWLLHTTRLTRPELRVLYDVYGELPKREETLDHLRGHLGSRPVRIKNAAVGQLQLDTYGEVIDAVARMGERGVELDAATQSMLRGFGRYVCEHAREPDHGIWEWRHDRRNHTHSRLLCWVALERLLALHARCGLARLDVERTRRARDLIRADIETQAFDAASGSYAQTLGGHEVDASLLLMPWYGFVDAADPRARGTFRRVCERLLAGPGLLYRSEQSPRIGEGAFGICSFWAVDYLARGGGSLREAEAWFTQLLAYPNDVGLYGEEIDPRTGAPLGNFPQAFTHVGLVNAALALEERRRSDRTSDVRMEAHA